jgi:hypothetical protein
MEYRVWARFSAPVQAGPGANSASYTMGTRSFQGVKRPGRGVDHLPHLAPRLKKVCSSTSTPPLGLYGLFLDDLYRFNFGGNCCLILWKVSASIFRNLQHLSSETCSIYLQQRAVFLIKTAAFIFSNLQPLSSVTCSIYLQQPATFIFRKLHHFLQDPAIFIFKNLQIYLQETAALIFIKLQNLSSGAC